MKKYIYPAIIIIIFSALNSFGQVFQWVNTGGGTANDESYCVVVDKSSGDVLITGEFDSTANLGGFVLNCPGQSGAFVAKYNSSGAPSWVNSFSGPDLSSGHVLNIDLSGNVYVTGEFDSTITLGSTIYTSSGLDDIFIAKYNSSGVFQWAVTAGGPGRDGSGSIRSDVNGNVYITGHFEDTISFGSLHAVSAGGEDIFAVKLNSFGNPVWLTSAGGPDDDKGSGLSADNAGNLFVAGFFNGTVNFNGTTLIDVNSLQDMFIMKLNPSGIIQWAKQGGGTGIDLAYEVATDGAGNAYVTGSFQNSGTFAPVVVNTNGGDDLFLAKYNSAGIVKWVKSAGGPLNDKAYAVSYDQAGRIYITGSFDSTITVDGNNYLSNGDKDIFAISYDTSGNLLSTIFAGGTGFDRGYGIANDNSGGVYVTGTFEQTATFGAFPVNSAGLHDIFVAKISGLNGISEYSTGINNLEIFPNPSTESIKIKSSRLLTTSLLEVIDAKGSVIIRKALNGIEEYMQDISGFPDGLYHVQLLTSDGRISYGRFVKQ